MYPVNKPETAAAEKWDWNLLLDAARNTINSGKLEKDTQAALACKDDEALEAHLREAYGIDLPHWMRNLEGEEREDAIRARIGSVLRSELVQFEQTPEGVLLRPVDERGDG